MLDLIQGQPFFIKSLIHLKRSLLDTLKRQPIQGKERNLLKQAEELFRLRKLVVRTNAISEPKTNLKNLPAKRPFFLSVTQAFLATLKRQPTCQ